MVCINVEFLEVGFHLLDDYRVGKTEFILALTRTVKELGIMGSAVDTLEIMMDTSTIPRDLIEPMEPLRRSMRQSMGAPREDSMKPPSVLRPEDDKKRT